jgi:hypothetical protein
LNDSIGQLNVAEQSLEVKGVKTDLPGVGIDQFVVEDDRNIKLRIARQSEACRFISGVELVEDEVEALESFVSILSSVVNTVVVIPHGAE